MKQENNNYIIYKAENIENGQVYIGATTNSVNQRKLDHTGKANRGEEGKFYKAISTYGNDAFKWEQIDTAININELAAKEKIYIVKYHSNEDGYNSDSGGGFRKTVYQYNLKDGILVKSYQNLKDAGNAVNATKQDISRACLSVNKTLGSFYWSYTYTEPFKPCKDARKKEVFQFTLEGNLIARYVSVSDAFRQTGYSKTCISRVCRRERAYTGRYIWRYSYR